MIVSVASSTPAVCFSAVNNYFAVEVVPRRQPVSFVTDKSLSVYLLLTEFEVRTVSYGPSFFPVDSWPINQREIRGSVTYSAERENEVSKVFIISLRLIRRAGKETSRSQAEGSTARKIAVSKSEKTKSSWLFEMVACKIQTVLQVYVTETT